MEFLEGEEDEARTRRKRLGKRLGVFGIALLFGSAISLRLVPVEWVLPMLVLVATGAIIMIVSYLLVR